MSEWKDGLPGVGDECEYTFSGDNDWRKGVCVAHYEEQAVMVDLEDRGAACCIIQRLRPIKKREPKPGEVWAVRGRPALYSPGVGSCYEFYELNGDNAWSTADEGKHAEYLAPSVKAYIARELYHAGRNDCMTKSTRVWLNTQEAARLDEE